MQQSAIYGAVVAAAVEAIRSRVPAIDGWKVLLIAGLAAILLGALSVEDGTQADLIAAGRLTAMSWIVAIGGNAWIAKIAGKIGGA